MISFQSPLNSVATEIKYISLMALEVAKWCRHVATTLFLSVYSRDTAFWPVGA